VCEGPFGQKLSDRRCADIAYILGAFPSLSYHYIRNADYRDKESWRKEAARRYALDQIRACEAALLPHMEEEDQRAYLQGLVSQIPRSEDDTPRQETSRPTAAQEAEWAKNRAELAAMFGRKL
jgi:hypothetical protein